MSAPGKNTAWLKNPQSHWSPEQRKALVCAVQRGDTLAYWCSDAFGRPANGGQFRLVVPASAGAVHRIRAKKAVICDEGGLHATAQPEQWKGSRVWVVALRGDIIRQPDKFAATVREFIGEIYPEEAVLHAGAAARVGRANLESANLESANLVRANLESASLESANLYSANLESANLVRANLVRANLYSANLESANLESANLYSANLESANLESANLESANLESANLESAWAPNLSPLTVARLLDFGWVVNPGTKRLEKRS